MSAGWIEADWPAPAPIRAGTTLRAGGASTGAHAGLNLADHVGDLPGAVRANRALLARTLALPAEPPWLRQVHGTRVVDAASGAARAARADACVARASGRVCAVLTADCLPLLLCRDDGACFGAVHAGWRGLLAGVIETAVSALSTPPGRLLAWLGPAIGAARYEVGGELREAFVRARPEHAGAFVAALDGRWHCDLVALARQRLRAAGVERVHGGGWCTASDPVRFYSYRRERRCGRMATLIWRRG